MKSRPILFSAPMVRALLDGSKTQTRRVMKPQMVYGDVCGLFNSWYLPKGKDGGTLWPNAKEQILATSPYGQVGDQLWVRETHAPQADCWGAWDKWLAGICYQPKPIIHYAADFKPFENDRLREEKKPFIEKWRPSIHMPRFASRITLEITSMRVERLKDISEADAIAEGCVSSINLQGGRFANENYRLLWETINGDDSWDLNPWVWVIEFKKVKS